MVHTLAPLLNLLPFNFQAAFLKQRQDELLKEQWELDQLESERKQREEGRKKQEHGYVDAVALAGRNRKGKFGHLIFTQDMCSFCGIIFSR